MKRKSIIVLVVLLLLSMTMAGCGAKAKTFTKNDMSITLTADFEEKPKNDANAYYESNKAILFCYQDPNEGLKGAGLDPATLTLKEYAEKIVEMYGIGVAVVEVDGLYVFDFYETTADYEFYHMGTVQKGPNSFWVFEFVCQKKDQNSMSKQFIKWAKTIKIN